MHKNLSLLLVLVSLFSLGCASIARVEQLELSKDGLTIQEVNGKFKFDESSIYFPPESKQCVWTAKFQRNSIFGDTNQGFIDIKYFADVRHTQKAADIGHRIILTKPGFGNRYGALLLCEIYTQCPAGVPEGSGVEKHLIQVSDDAFRNSKDGNVVVAYDSVKVRGCAGEIYTPTWLIWMSDEVFW